MHLKTEPLITYIHSSHINFAIKLLPRFRVFSVFEWFKYRLVVVVVGRERIGKWEVSLAESAENAEIVEVNSCSW